MLCMFGVQIATQLLASCPALLRICWPRVYFSDLGNGTMYGNISQSLV